MTENNSYEPLDIFNPEISYSADPEYDPSADNKKAARTIFSRTHLALFIYMLASQMLSLFIARILLLFLPTEWGVMLVSDYTFSILLTIVCQYVISFPIFLLASKGIRKRSYAEKSKISTGSFLLYLVLSQGAMLVGALISNAFASILDLIYGGIGDNAVDDIVYETPVWLLFLTVCVLAPFFEEMMFRKIMFDRISAMGDKTAILFTALAFGFIHASIYQILYATALGLILGYVYSKTRRVGYTMLIHSIVNFLGSIIPLLLTGIIERGTELEALESMDIMQTIEYIGISTITLLYSLTNLAFIGGSVAILIVALVKRSVKIGKGKDIRLDNSTLLESALLNPGFILFYSLVLILTLISIFLV